MSFVARVDQVEPFETWSRMELAALQRWWDAVALAGSNEARHTGAVYLFGYVAEILLKTAYFRFSGLSASADFTATRRQARQNVLWLGGNEHSVVSWAHLLIETRAQTSNPMDVTLAGLVKLHASVVHGNWREYLRYRSTDASQAEILDVRTSTEWILANYERLWG